MAYIKIGWENYPSQATPIDEDNLNHMENGIEEAVTGLDLKVNKTDYDAFVELLLPVDTETGNSAVITDAFGGAAKALSVTFEPTQSGSGTPSPSNVRPISGLTEADITVADAETDPTQTHTYNIDLDETRYGGTVDFKTGEAKIDIPSLIEMSTLNWTYDASTMRFVANIADVKIAATRTLKMWATCYQCISDGRPLPQVPDFSIYTAQNILLVHDSRYTTVPEFKTALAGQMLAYPLATPIAVQLTPEEVTLLRLNNVLTTNGSDISVSYSADVQAYVDKKVAEGSASVATLSLTKSGSTESTEETTKTVESEEK